MIPDFEADGNLPAGVHEATWDEFINRFGTTTHRQRLLQGLKAGLEALRDAGCRRVYVDGSFVTAKEKSLNEPPGDFDVCWEAAGVDPDRLDPVLLVFDVGRATQKSKYMGEFFPAHTPAKKDGTTFFDFFQNDKNTGRAKGIIALNLRRLP